jgi:hypothetical protein
LALSLIYFGFFMFLYIYSIFIFIIKRFYLSFYYYFVLNLTKKFKKLSWPRRPHSRCCCNLIIRHSNRSQFSLSTGSVQCVWLKNVQQEKVGRLLSAKSCQNTSSKKNESSTLSADAEYLTVQRLSCSVEGKC